MGLRIGNRTQFHVLLWIAFKEHPMLSHQPFYDSPSGAKVIIFFKLPKTFIVYLLYNFNINLRLELPHIDKI
jgi:hypothetical protein